jgi:CRISPR-associated protein Cas2
MVYVITYDIPNDKVRNRVAQFLETKGTRVQESVFECRRRPGRAMVLAESVKRILEGAEGNVRIYQVCSECMKQSLGVGDIINPPRDKGYFLF